MAVLRQSGKTLPELTYCCRHIRRLTPLLSKAMKPRAKARPDMMMRWACAGKTTVSGLALQSGHPATPLGQVMRAAAKNMHSNGYHHPWHTITVMMMAGLLGKRARLTSSEQSVLLIYGLIHDLDHRGRFMAHRAYAEEERSARIATRRLFGQRSGCGTEQRRMMTAIKATSFTADDMGEGDAVTALLKDADIMASVLFPKDDVLKLTKGLKREMATRLSSQDLLAEFLNTVDRKGFAHPAADMMVAVVRGYARDIIPLSAFQSDPSEGVRHSDAKE